MAGSLTVQAMRGTIGLVLFLLPLLLARADAYDVLPISSRTVVHFPKLCTTIFGHQKGLTISDCKAFPDSTSCAKALTESIKVQIQILVDESNGDARDHREIVCAFDELSVKREAVAFCSRHGHAQSQSQCVEQVSRGLEREFAKLNERTTCDSYPTVASKPRVYYDYNVAWMATNKTKDTGRVHIVDNALPPRLFCLLSAEVPDAFQLNLESYVSDLQKQKKLSYSNFVIIEDIDGSVRSTTSSRSRRTNSSSVSNNEDDGNTERPAAGVPRTAIELTILHLLRLNFPDGHDGIIGAEWWIQIREERDSVPFHYDKDEAASLMEEGTAHPVLSTVTYLTGNADDRSTGDSSSSAQSDLQNPTVVVGPHAKTEEDHERIESVVVYPKKNRHMTFGGNLHHGVAESVVVESGDRRFERDDNNIAEDRITFLVNFWDHRPRPELCAEMSDEVVHKLLSKRSKVHRKSLSELISTSTLSDESKFQSNSRSLSRVAVGGGNIVDRSSFVVGQFTHLPLSFSAKWSSSILPVPRVSDPERAYVVDWYRREERTSRFCVPRTFGQLLECVDATHVYARERYKYRGPLLVLLVSGSNVLSSQGNLFRGMMDIKATYEHRVAIVYVNRNVYIRSPKHHIRPFEERFSRNHNDDFVCASLLSFRHDSAKRTIFCSEPTGYDDSEQQFCTCERLNTSGANRHLQSRTRAWFEWSQAPRRIGL